MPKKRPIDPTLDRIFNWLDENGWDQTRSESFFEFLRSQGIDESSLSVHVSDDPLQGLLDFVWPEEGEDR
jgi:hypothetical protein